ncbi:MAG: hypothetical protein OQK12_17260 [Motiliproteus sp.]|nr:hypothetical protein [Motiliproteus sp.]MCW9052972.1 hypothetical protein [Motiliproteus sp.]
MNTQALISKNISTDQKVQLVENLVTAGYREVGVYENLKDHEYKVMPYFSEKGNPKSEVLWRLEIRQGSGMPAICFPESALHGLMG